jgi:hypothetical protein
VDNTESSMTAKEFWNTQVPTDANKCYVSDFYVMKFDHYDLFRFAEAYAAQNLRNELIKYTTETGLEDEKQATKIVNEYLKSQQK